MFRACMCFLGKHWKSGAARKSVGWLERGKMRKCFPAISRLHSTHTQHEQLFFSWDVLNRRKGRCAAGCCTTPVWPLQLPWRWPHHAPARSDRTPGERKLRLLLLCAAEILRSCTAHVAAAWAAAPVRAGRHHKKFITLGALCANRASSICVLRQLCRQEKPRCAPLDLIIKCSLSLQLCILILHAGALLVWKQFRMLHEIASAPPHTPSR